MLLIPMVLYKLSGRGQIKLSSPGNINVFDEFLKDHDITKK